jgi:hypothetical protein
MYNMASYKNEAWHGMARHGMEMEALIDTQLCNFVTGTEISHYHLECGLEEKQRWGLMLGREAATATLTATSLAHHYNPAHTFVDICF